MKNLLKHGEKETAEAYKNHNRSKIYNYIERKTRILTIFLAVFNSMLCIVAGVLTIGTSTKYSFNWGIPIGIFIIVFGCITCFLTTLAIYVVGKIAILTYEKNTEKE